MELMLNINLMLLPHVEDVESSINELKYAFKIETPKKKEVTDKEQKETLDNMEKWLQEKSKKKGV